MIELGPALPRNWYLLGQASAFKQGAVSAFEVGGTGIVLFRGRETRRLTAFAAHCAHMGCHLAKAEVVLDDLKCALHHRIIKSDGRFAGASELEQKTYPVREYLGGAFVYLGPGQPPELDLVDATAFKTCFAGEHRFPLSWQTLVANGFDIEHLASVHDRRLLESPTLEPVATDQMQLRYRTRPTSGKISDRIMSWLAKDGVAGSIRTISGTMMLVESVIGARRTFILMSFAPDAQQNTVIRGIVGIKSASALTGKLQARIASSLFKAFLNKDVGVLDGLKWHEPKTQTSLGDHYTVKLCDFFRGLEHA
jgi:nitrite reductase/ring-hydroxylating ferredoxin subunit